jgi:hypothetical protein
MKRAGIFAAIVTKTVLVLGGVVLLVGCSSNAQPTAVPTTANTNSAVTPQGNPGNTAVPGLKDACVILTASTIKTITGVDFNEGQTSPSYTNGTTCKYTSVASNATSLSLQISVGKEYYLGDAATGAQSGGVGDKSYIMPLTGLTTTLGALKGNIGVMVSLNGFHSITLDQAKALLKAIVDQLP